MTTKLEHKTFTSERKSFDDSTLTIEHVISTEMQDSGGDIMLADGMVVRGLPVVLFQHGLDEKRGNEPIAKVLSLSVGTTKSGTKGIVAKTQYYDGSKHGDNDGRILYEKARDGFMPNWSIGFNSLEERPLPNGGRVVTKWELFEYSQVAVGMNSECQTVGLIAPQPLKFIVPQIKTNTTEGEAQMDVKTEAAPERKSILEKCVAAKTKGALDMHHKAMKEEIAEKCKAVDFHEQDHEKCAKEIAAERASLDEAHIKEFFKCAHAMTKGMLQEDRIRKIDELHAQLHDEKDAGDMETASISTPEVKTPETTPSVEDEKKSEEKSLPATETQAATTHIDLDAMRKAFSEGSTTGARQATGKITK